MAKAGARGRRFWFFRIVSIVGIALGALLIAITGAFVAWEATWVTDQHYDERDAFLKGSIGTEIAPLAVVKVLPELAPEAFLPGGPDAGDMIEQFGYIRRPADDPYAALPVGFTVGNYRPLSGAPSPIPFVGIGCSTCHTSALHHPSLEEPAIVSGAGNPALDLIGWGNAVEAALTAKGKDGEWLVTLERIVAASDEPIPWFPDQLIIAVWLSQARAQSLKLAEVYDDAEIGVSLRDSRVGPEGPIRTTPFKSLVRRLLDRPGSEDAAFSKIPVAHHQGWKAWAQFDGSIRSPELRSALAAMTIMAARDNLMQPEIGRNVVFAAHYLLDLGGPRFAEVFPDAEIEADGASIENGRTVYEWACAGCHGRPSADGGWDGETERFGEVIPVEEIGTDPRRVTFRHNTELPAAIMAHMSVFPEGHPFRVQPGEMRPNPEDIASFVPGYLAGPIDSAYARAPYLHNGSVLTLAELINLEPRRRTFCRGAADYDTERVGLAYVAPDRDADGRLRCDLSSRHYFLFDASEPGNSAGGHDYPWRYGAPGWNPQELRDLLAYLKTL